jgi:hypothetical protein
MSKYFTNAIEVSGQEKKEKAIDRNNWIKTS